jgi:hypothetical protein
MPIRWQWISRQKHLISFVDLVSVSGYVVRIKADVIVRFNDEVVAVLTSGFRKGAFYDPTSATLF